MTADEPSKSPANDPIEAQLRFEAALYGDWYSKSVLASYVQEKSSKETLPEVTEAFSPGHTHSED
tara:strand:- start:25 stop:219 length:195 start_codon:yes stop_codon:yes gene_type:complete